MSKCVYAFAKGDRIKIGVSSNPEYRARGLGSKVVFMTPVMEDYAAVEATAHQLLIESRAGGEWFTVSAAVAIEAIRAAVSMVSSGDMSFCRRLPKERGAPINRMTNPITVRLTQDEMDALRMAAQAEGRTVSAMARNILRMDIPELAALSISERR